MNDLGAAIEANDADRVERLMKDGQSKDHVRGAMIRSIEGKRSHMLEILLRNGADPNAVIPGQDWTLLHFAVEHQNADALVLLLARGGSVASRDSLGCTPLHHAVDVEADAAHQAGEPLGSVLIRILLKAGANPTAKDREGKTPIDVALDYEYAAGFAEMTK